MSDVKRLLLIGMESYYGRGVTEGVHNYCREHGNWEYHMEMDSSPASLRRSVFAIRHWKADGVIARIVNKPMERLLLRSGLPVVNFSGLGLMKTPTVVIDSVALGEMAAEHLLDNGFRNFAYCSLTVELYSQERYQGFSRRLAEAGYDCATFTDKFAALVESDWVNNRRRMDQWLLSLKKPVALLCIYSLRGQEVAVACRKLGLRVPDDVAIVSGDGDDPVALMCSPPLSNFAMDHPRIGYEAARLLDKLMRGHKPPKDRILIPPTRVVIRQSSNVVAMDDLDVAATLRYIRDNVARGLSVKQLLQEVPISRKAMERRFLKNIGRTPKAEIMRVRMQVAQALLEQTDLPIPQVAIRSGFGGQEIFSTTFRRKMGTTPTLYRRQFRMTLPTGSLQ